MKMKNCSRCEIEKPLDSFSEDKQHPSGLKRECRACASKRFSEWRNKDIVGIRKKDRIKHYMRKYNLSIEEATSLVETRIGVCKICNEVQPLVGDHCHKSRVVRGLICSACNSLLGYSKDNVKTLQEAIKYLEKFYVV